MTNLYKKKSLIFEQIPGGKTISREKSVFMSGGKIIPREKSVFKTDDKTTQKVDSVDNLPDIKVINVKDKYPEDLEIKLFNTYYGREGFFVKDYSFVKAVQEALNNTDKTKNLPGSNFVPGWED